MELIKIVISDTVLLAVITSFTGIITLFLNHKLGKVHKQINSRMDELLNISRAEALAEGTLKGRADEKAENVAATTTSNHGLPTEAKIEGEIVIKPKDKKP